MPSILSNLLAVALVAVVAAALLAGLRRRHGGVSRGLGARDARRRGAAPTLARGSRRTNLVTDAEWQAFLEVKAGITGRKGEALVARELARLGLPVLHDIVLADSRGLTQIDHVVLGLDAIIVLETKTYSGFITGDPRGREWTQDLAKGATRIAFQSPVRQNMRHRAAVLEIVADLPIAVRGYVVSAGTARFCDVLAGIVVALDGIARVVLPGAPVRTDERVLRMAWERLTAAAQAGEARRAEYLATVRTARGVAA